MKKLLVILLVAVMLVLFCACALQDDTSAQAKEEKAKARGERFVVITSNGFTGASGYYTLFYDIQTKVMYISTESYKYGGGLTPLLDADGNVMLYDGE